MSTTVVRAGVPYRAGAYTPATLWGAILAIGVFAQLVLTPVWRAGMLAAMLLVTVIQLAVAASFFPLLTRSRGARLGAWFVTSVAIFTAPFLIPSDARPLRFVTACASVILVMKLWDLHVSASRGQPMPWERFAPHLVNPFALLSRMRLSPPIARERLLRDAARQALASVAGALAIAALFLIRWRSVPLAVEHAVKAAVIFTAIVAFLELVVAVVRLTGGTLPDFTRSPLLARTPADFWRRYNIVFQQYFFENVFRSIGGRKAPRVATLLIFALSGVVHEYVFGIAIGRVTGYQMTFFLLQGIGVAATLRAEPRGRIAVAASTAATIAFNLATSFFFFLSFHAIVRIYANPLPGWLW